MKIFIIAYACEPNRQSEPGLGWNVSGEIARRHRVTVLTRANNRKAIEEYLLVNHDVPQTTIRFLYFDRGRFLCNLKKKIPFGDQLYFSLWLKAAVKKFRGEVANHDIVHQLTFCPFFVKPWGAAYSDVYVWGPIGGGGGVDAHMPKAFCRGGLVLRFREWLYRGLGYAVNCPMALHFNAMRRRVAAVLFKARAFAVNFPIVAGQVSSVVQETGYGGKFSRREYRLERHALNVVSVGRMIPHKGGEYVVRGFASFLEHGGAGCLHFYGDGPLKVELQTLSRTLGVADKVMFHGNVENAKIHEALADADIFLHGSFVEAAAWSILEAMIHGVPVVCQDRSGMADMVTDECGTKVAATTPNGLICGFSSALMKYWGDPDLVRRNGEAGQRRVRAHYTWTKCGDLIDEIYEKVIERKTQRPQTKRGLRQS